MTKSDQIMVMLEAFGLVRERLCLDFLVEELRTDIGRTDYYDYAERTAKAWLVKELSGEETAVPCGPHGKGPAIPTLAVAQQQHALIPTQEQFLHAGRVRMAEDVRSLVEGG